MEVESAMKTRRRCFQRKLRACQTFAEAQEFFLTRLHARAFTQDLEPQATLVTTGLSVDQWPVHMRLPHKEKMRRLEFPADLLKGEEPIVEFPARIALATAAKYCAHTGSEGASADRSREADEMGTREGTTDGH